MVPLKDSRLGVALLSVGLALQGLVACGDTGSGGASADDDTANAQEPITAQPQASCEFAQHGGHEYWFCRDNLPWADAEAACAGVGTHLVKIESAAENTFVRSKSGLDSWIGANDRTTEGAWGWALDGAAFWNGNWTGSAVGGAYRSWALLQPNDTLGQDCAKIDAGGGWWDESCSLPKDFVCESTAASASAPQAPDTACTRAERDGHEYWFCSNGRSYDQAVAACQGVGHDLTAIGDASENAFVRAHVQVDSFIGVSDGESEGKWKWAADGRLNWCGAADGRPASGQAYSAWSAGHPRALASCRLETSGGRDYWFCDDWRTFDAARSACQGVGMSLVRIDSAGENTFVRSHLTINAWMGATDLGQEGTWSWTDNGDSFWTGGLFGHSVGGRYTNWRLANPGYNLLEGCGSIALLDGRWQDDLCALPLSWACEGPSGAAIDPPDVSDCARLSKGDGKWRSGECGPPAGYVCETPPQNKGLTLDALSDVLRDRVEGESVTVSHVQLAEGSAVDDVFLTYGDRLDLRACVDTFEPIGTPRAVPTLGTEAQTYRQQYKGVPVITRGYSVHTDPASGFVRSVNGRFEPGLDLSTTPTLTVSQGRAAALAAAGHVPADFAATPTGTLSIVPSGQGPATEFELAWYFVLEPIAGGRVKIAVSAQDGGVLLRDRGRRYSCASTDVTAGEPLVPASIDVSTWLWVQNPTNASFPYTPRVPNPTTAVAQQILGTACADCGGSCSGGSCLCSDGTTTCFATPYVLATEGVQGVLPPMHMQCTGQVLPYVTSVASPWVISMPPDPGAPNDPDRQEDHMGAALYQASQKCFEFYADTFEASPNVPWVGFDGFGTVPASLRLYPGSVTYFDPSDWTVYFGVTSNPADYMGASIETACHELTHGLWAQFLVDPLDVEGAESRSLDEGVASIMGNAAEMRVRGYPGPNEGGWCFGGDEADNVTCLEDFSDPGSSTASACTHLGSDGTPLSTRCPRAYRDADFCALGLCDHAGPPQTRDLGCCDEHKNSSVVEHWFYILTTGATGTSPNGCGYSVTPIGSGLAESVRLASQVVFQAMNLRLLGMETGFEGFANATITAARSQFGVESAQFRSVVDAWAAVQVREQVAEGLYPELQPARGAQNVNPWVTFEWPANGETQWEFRLGVRTLDAPIYTTTVSDTREGPNGPIAYTKVALPENDASRYVWQAVPTLEPRECEPIHWFEGTSTVEDIDSLAPGDDLFTIVHPPSTSLSPLITDGHWTPIPDSGVAPDGKARPGTVHFFSNAIEGAASYELFVRPDEVDPELGCTEAASITATVPADDIHVLDDQVWIFARGLQPEETYHAYIRAVGPPHVFAGETFSNCFHAQLATAPMRAPELRWPISSANPIVEYTSPHDHSVFGPLRFEWWTDDGAASYVMHFYARNADGTCSPTAEFTAAVPAACSGPCQPIALATDVLHSPVNPEGYCWNVHSIAANGSVSDRAAEPYSFRFVFPFMATHPETFDAEGNPLQLSWDPAPAATTYGLKIGRSPWSVELGAPYPPNCILPTQLACGYESASGMVTRTGLSATSIDAAPLVTEPGRYCWSVWPELGGTSGEPLVRPHLRCFTTPPAEPIFDLPTSGAPGQVVTGTVTFPYVPNGQRNLDWNLPAHTSVQWDCEPEPGAADLDVYDCVGHLSITLQVNATHTFTAETFNSDATPPVQDETTRVHSVGHTIRVDPCGNQANRCCPGSECLSTSLYCDSSDGRCHQKKAELSVTLEYTFCDHGGTSVHARIRNTGQVDATTVVRVGNGSQFVDYPVTVPAEDEIEDDFDGVARNITSQIHVEVDPLNQVPEEDERNNEAHATLGTNDFGGCPIDETSSGLPAQCPYASYSERDITTGGCVTRTVDVLRSGNIELWYNRYDIPDSISIHEGSNALSDPIFSVECAADTNDQQRFFHTDSSTLTIKVCPNCTGTTNTDWDIVMSCGN